MPTLLCTIILGSVIIRSFINDIRTLAVIAVFLALLSSKGTTLIFEVDNFKVINSRLPFTLESLIFTIPVFMCGVYFREYVLNFKPSLLNFFYCFLIIVFFVKKLGILINVGSFIYAPYFPSLVCSLLSIYMVLCLSQYLSKMPYISYLLCFCGKNSLYITLFHGVLLFWFGVFLNKPDLSNIPMLTKDWMIYIATVIFSLLVKVLFSNFKITRWMFAIKK